MMHAQRVYRGGSWGHTPIDDATKAVSKQYGAGAAAPALIYECWVCDFLEVSPVELEQMDEEEIEAMIGYRMGKSLAETHMQMLEAKKP